MRFFSAIAALLPLAGQALAAPYPFPDPADAAAAPARKSACPEVFAIYLGRGNDAQNRTWWFRTFGEGKGMRLSAIPEGVSTFRLVGTTVQLASNASIELNAFDDEREYIMPVSESLKEEHPDGWGDLLNPIEATINPKDCEIKLVYDDKKYLQRYGFNVDLTVNATGGQIQWPKAWAVPPPVSAEVMAFSKPRCEEAYYKEPCK
ncbi:hypothetical protein K461DRAFT_275417 [Myriangium duriaei CBS 260.36]|uniref:Uncharacterized protein n=1 Tax=Myriangium duriaei CBS 260.36 TaxID=1168546 RepID=A0A9P4MKG5_9PEZI|nr:hypothetical protein K461DRAFT_275417 [Myriangium duriaei CBS 260.36]